MRRLFILPVLALAASGLALGVGDKAPALKVATVVKGKTATLAKGVHVVEFWATWCGPCRVSIPHLTELAKKYKGKADFTGVSISERGADQLGQVKKFVAQMGPKMDYNVAWDGASATTFVVKDGNILWIGHPMDGLDEAVGQAVAGKLTLQEAKKQADEKAKAQQDAMKKQAEMAALLQPVMQAMQEGDTDGALAELDKIEAGHADLKPVLGTLRFRILMGQGGGAKLTALAQRFATEDFKDDAVMLNQLAWSIIDPEAKSVNPNYDAALIMAKRAVEVSKGQDGAILDTYALTLFKTGDKAKAIEMQTKAVELARKDKETEPATLKEMEARLEEFKKSA
jgi:thiol-disulfide isomerase/thioredoxin